MPSRKSLSVGYEVMPNSLARAPCAVASTLPSRARLDSFFSVAAAWAKAGASRWQCPHHGASAGSGQCWQ